MTITGALLFRFWQREQAFQAVHAGVRPLLGLIPIAQQHGDVMADLAYVATRIAERADAWTELVIGVQRRASPEAFAEADRLCAMLAGPHNFPVAELLAVRRTLGVSIDWCCRQGHSDARGTVA